jgi:chorismate mutase/prephenate dehydrogenase
MIDAIDREVLQLLARRMGIVAEVAAWKRQHAARIRDLARERDLLGDRRARAERLGLSPETVESIFRLVLLASREHQAALRAEVPADVEARTVGIVGGHGGMGALFGRLFADLGHPVLVSDLGTELSNVEVARAADVVVVAVPIGATVDVIREVGPHVRADALLCDVTSLKVAPMEAMLASTRASVLGLHPMFGPRVHSLQGQRVVVCDGRGDEWARWMRRMLHARGLSLTEATPEAHDRAMAAVQVLTHFKTQVTALALARLGVPLRDTLDFTSPAYLMDLYVEGRHFAQSPELYGPIEMENPRTREVTAVFAQAASEVASILAARDQARFRAMFEEVRAYFGPFTDVALEQSSFLIDRLVERS